MGLKETMRINPACLMVRKTLREDEIWRLRNSGRRVNPPFLTQ
ncbi:MAG: hypothetical protein JWN70_6484 [Planctomycetaceae bacterium]|nr:hypothetical protein [Planctomycetaceae bacterium]